MTDRAKPKSTPAFLTKLYSMVDTATEHGITWAPDGLAFIVPNPRKFANESLPQWFNHSKFSSFVRQLNMYDFHKMPSLLDDDESVTFKHELFQRARPHMLNMILRKKSGAVAVEVPSATGSKRSAAKRGSASLTTTRNRRPAASSDKRNVPSDLSDPPPRAVSDASRPSPAELPRQSQADLAVGANAFVPLNNSAIYYARTRSYSVRFPPVSFDVPFVPLATPAITNATQAPRFGTSHFMPSVGLPPLGSVLPSPPLWRPTRQSSADQPRESES